MSLLRPALGALTFLFLSVLGGGCNGCGASLGPEDAGVDAGAQLISCTEASECPLDVPECSFGVCKRPCAANDACPDPSTFCDATTGYCAPGCRDSSTCEDGTVCSAGACIVSQGCATKCDCAPGQVCANGSCQAPPPTCTGPQDCGRGPADPDECEDYACNGFTSQCFDPDPTPCASNADCTGRPGCAGGCTCTGSGTCAPEVDCTADNEATSCGADFYCDGNGSCQALPACTQEAECTSAGLSCNVGRQRCERTRACTASTECTAAPNTYCNTTAGYCAVPLCNNGGITCAPTTETCSADGRCVPAGTGTTCTNDLACPGDQYCAANGQCAVGCRDNSSCNGGQTCNGAHQCTGGGGGGGGLGAACVNGSGDPDDTLCQVGLFCGPLSGTCQEGCVAESTDCATDGCCQLTGQGCCTLIFFVGVCQGC